MRGCAYSNTNRSNERQMKRTTLYSSSGRSRPARPPQVTTASEPTGGEAAAPTESPAKPSTRPPSRWRRLVGRYSRPLLVAIGALLALGLVAGYQGAKPPPRVFTQEDIDAAVLHTL